MIYNIGADRVLGLITIQSDTLIIGGVDMLTVTQFNDDILRAIDEGIFAKKGGAFSFQIGFIEKRTEGISFTTFRNTEKANVKVLEKLLPDGVIVTKLERTQ